jgi:hypothetical protein
MASKQNDTDKVNETKEEIQKLGKELAPVFNKEDYMETKEVETKEGLLVKATMYKKAYSTKGSTLRGKLRTADAYGVSIDHLSKVAIDLNNKKIDGIYVNDLLGRHGFYDGKVMSRNDLAKQYNVRKSVIEMAVEKLKGIVSFNDVLSEYNEYLEIFRQEKKRKLQDEIEGN